MPHSVFRHRRHRVRLLSFCIAAAVTVFCTMLQQRALTKTRTIEENRLQRAVLTHMSEEHAKLRTALTDGDSTAVLCHANALCGYAALIGTCGDAQENEPLRSALCDTAQFYAALARYAEDGSAADPSFWIRCCDTVSAHTAILALSATDRLQPSDPTPAELAAAEALSAFSASFYTEPLRLDAGGHPGYRFDREVPITQAEARQKLCALVGGAASFLGNTVTDDAHGCYVFTCKNGYAELSRCGGHLLSYAFYPRISSDTDPHMLCDTELSSLALSFLKKTGIPIQNADTWDDRHGIRYFTAKTTDGHTVTLGIRMHDGTVVQFRAESYYRLDPQTGP
ncbi:MAG: hypothetical protein IKZ09_02070 [Clostridia bacterium]|nr:hypothetical protein [Clostridia bacterium]